MLILTTPFYNSLPKLMDDQHCIPAIVNDTRHRLKVELFNFIPYVSISTDTWAMSYCGNFQSATTIAIHLKNDDFAISNQKLEIRELLGKLYRPIQQFFLRENSGTSLWIGI